MQNNLNIPKEIFKSWCDKFCDNINMISDICFLIGLYITIRYNQNLPWWQNFLLLAAYFVLIMSVQSFERWRRNKLKIGTMPVRKKRFTIKLDEATVVKKSDMEEAILYLSEVEDYLGK